MSADNDHLDFAPDLVCGAADIHRRRFLGDRVRPCKDLAIQFVKIQHMPMPHGRSCAWIALPLCKVHGQDLVENFCVPLLTAALRPPTRCQYCKAEILTGADIFTIQELAA